MLRKIILSVWIVILVATTSLSGSTYSWNNETIVCKSRTVSVGTLTSADYDQGQSAQDTAWATFKSTYGLADSDRLGNQTATYNCHSYCFRGSDKWLNSPSNYYGDTSGCWIINSSGTVKSDSTHSCLVSDNTGKCGEKFLCKNNQKVYNPMPTDIYCKVN
jgi:hypothetical protein